MCASVLNFGDNTVAEKLTGQQLWKRASKHLADRLSKDIFDRWIAVIEADSFDGKSLKLSVANDFYQTWLIDNYLGLIREATTLAAGDTVEICFSVSSEEPMPASRPRMAQPRRKTAHEKPTLNNKYTFDSFVVGPSNNFAHAAALAVAESPSQAYNPLFIHGGVGLGKTHLMQAIGHYVANKNNAKVTYLSSEEFVNKYIDAIQKKATVEFRRRYRKTDVLLIDDIHFLAGKNTMQEEFFHTFNALRENHKQIVLTSDRPASEIKGLEHRLVSRFEWGLVVEMEAPSEETRIAILRSKCEQLNLHLPEEMVTFIATNIRSNIRRLEGALVRSASYASLTGRELTIETLQYLLRDTLDMEGDGAAPLSIDRIQKAVAEYFDIRLSDLVSKKRPQNIAMPRQVAMYLSRDLTHQSLPAIGNAFDRNHATVLHACRNITQKMNKDQQFRASIQQLSRQLSNV